MAKYKVLHFEVTGLKGASFLKGQIVDENQLIGSAIDNLISTGAIELTPVVEVIEEKKDKKKKDSE